MKYLFAIVFPPLAVLTCGRPATALLNLFLTLLFWVPGVIHALLVVGQHNGDRRNKALMNAVRQGQPPVR
jgi:uncharacterized membrane protein YqaE (UPF0057 family)